MKISMLFNRISQLDVEHKYTSCKPLAHINELCKTNPGVVNPNSAEFNGEVLASTVYIEAKKLQDPINFLLVINEVLKNSISLLPNDFSQDSLMDIKHDISKNIVCKLHRDEREHMSELLSSERLHVIAAKLVYVQDFYLAGFLLGYLEDYLEGYRSAYINSILLILEDRFGKLPSWVEDKLTDADTEMLEQWLLSSYKVDQLDTVFK